MARMIEYSTKNVVVELKVVVLLIILAHAEDKTEIFVHLRQEMLCHVLVLLTTV